MHRDNHQIPERKVKNCSRELLNRSEVLRREVRGQMVFQKDGGGERMAGRPVKES